MRSPTCARSRRNAAIGATAPSAVTVIVNGPRVVSPPTNATELIFASAPKPAPKRSTQFASRSGKVSASKAHCGNAPIAARSDRFTASAFQPIAKASVALGKCRPATKVSQTATSCVPRIGSSTAPSSPMPSTTSSRTPRWVAARRRINSNSSSDSATSAAIFATTDVTRQLIEHTIDEGVAEVGTETLGRLNRFVDNDTIRHIEAMNQLVGAEA